MAFYAAKFALLMASGLTLALSSSADKIDLRELPVSDLSSGMGYELLITAIERMQQEIVDTRRQVKELLDSKEVLQKQLEQNYAILEQKIKDDLKQSLVDLRQQIENSLQRVNSSNVENFNQRMDDLKESSMFTSRSVFPNDSSSLETSNVHKTVYGSCQEVQYTGFAEISPPKSGIPPMWVYCLHGWMVFHARFDGLLDFNRGWTDYRDGFGNVDSEHWLGLEKLHRITASGSYELMIIMKRFDGSDWYANYQQIVVGSSAERYKLQLFGQSYGTAPDSLRNSNGMAFSTPDSDNDMAYGDNCAEIFKSGWWFNNCFHANLNGVYGTKKMDNRMHWDGFGSKESGLKEAAMMIRPRPHNSLSSSNRGSGFFYSQQSISSFSSRIDEILM